jgi:hypothetical protein
LDKRNHSRNSKNSCKSQKVNIHRCLLYFFLTHT